MVVAFTDPLKEGLRLGIGSHGVSRVFGVFVVSAAAGRGLEWGVLVTEEAKSKFANEVHREIGPRR